MKKAIFFVLIFCIYSIADASCIRCGLDKLACEGDSKFDAISQCGNPDHSEVVGEDTRGISAPRGKLMRNREQLRKCIMTAAMACS